MLCLIWTNDNERETKRTTSTKKNKIMTRNDWSNENGLPFCKQLSEVTELVYIPALNPYTISILMSAGWCINDSLISFTKKIHSMDVAFVRNALNEASKWKMKKKNGKNETKNANSVCIDTFTQFYVSHRRFCFLLFPSKALYHSLHQLKMMWRSI